MLPKTYLKFIAASIVYEASLSKYSKVQLIRFIEDASYDQLATFIKKGYIKEPEKVSEAFVVPAMLIVAAVSAANLIYDRNFSNAARDCAGRQNSKEKTQCLKNYRIRANTAKVAALKREIPKCSQTNNIKKCRDMFLKRIQKIENQIQRDKSI